MNIPLQMHFAKRPFPLSLSHFLYRFLHEDLYFEDPLRARKIIGIKDEYRRDICSKCKLKIFHHKLLCISH